MITIIEGSVEARHAYIMVKEKSQADIERIREVIKETDLCMLTTIGENGAPHTRPMSNNREVEFDGDLWFFTYGSTYKGIEIEKNDKVTVSFSAPEKGYYIVIQGSAELIRDKEKIKELWKPPLKLWFPEGIDEPDLALIKVNAESAEVWEGPANFFAKIWHFGKALVTGQQYDRENYHLDL